MSTSPSSSHPLTVYTQATPNGLVVPILLKELEAAYGAIDHETIAMSIKDADIGKVHNQVKSPWFLEINPNGRIPAIRHNGFSVFETSAILLYLGAQYDAEHRFSRDPVADPQGYSQELQWLFFAHGGIGPMQGQAGHFKFASEQIPYAINRYQNETRRLYGVLEAHLASRDYLVGAERGAFGIADIKTFLWVRSGPRVGVLLDDFPNTKAWVERIEARETVQAGLNALNN